MEKNDDLPILTFFHRAFSLFFVLASLIALFVVWEFFQARSHVTKKVDPIHKIHPDTVYEVYGGKEKVPLVLDKAMDAYNQQGEDLEPFRGFGFVSGFVLCPQSPQWWDILLERQELERVAAEWPDIIIQYAAGDTFPPSGESIKELLETRRRIIDILETEFPFGQPRAACAISLTLAMSGNLAEEKLASATKALATAEYIEVRMHVMNDGNTIAEGVEVFGPEHFECEEVDGGDDCVSFNLEVNREETFLFTGQPGLLVDKSDRDLQDMFWAKWEERAGPDRARISCWVAIAAVFTALVSVAELVWKHRTRLFCRNQGHERS